MQRSYSIIGCNTRIICSILKAFILDNLLFVRIPVIFTSPLIVVKPVLSIVITAPNPAAPIPNLFGYAFPKLYPTAQASPLALVERSIFLKNEIAA